jgi:hypothetical protein
MELRLIILLVLIWFSACHKPNPEVVKMPTEVLDLISSRAFSELNLEAKEVLKVRDYLDGKGLDIDSLYVYEIIFSDSCVISDRTVFSDDSIDACIAVFNIEHKVNHDYYMKLKVENNQILEDYEKENEVFSEPLLIPSKPDFLRKEILLYYYFKGDSIIEILSQ